MLHALKKTFKEPLLHFLLLGGLLYLLVDTFADTPLHDNYAIDVNSEVMVKFLQFQNKAFNASLAKNKWEGLDKEEKKKLVADYIREEVMYREALNMGLDLDDQIIRRRLIQKIEFINTGFTSSLAGIDEKKLSQHFTDNIKNYLIEESMTFSHVFFDKTLGQSQQKAQAMVQQLNAQSVPFEHASQFGQRFVFHRNYVDRTKNFVASHFGLPFSQQVFTLKPSDTWHGPIQSKYGSHLVNVKNNHPERIPNLEEVASQVLQDLQRVKQSELKTASLKNMINKYRIINEIELNDTNTGEHHASVN
jgi:peptidyl-prolyl cis-trans isomerase C